MIRAALWSAERTSGDVAVVVPLVVGDVPYNGKERRKGNVPRLVRFFRFHEYNRIIAEEVHFKELSAKEKRDSIFLNRLQRGIVQRKQCGVFAMGEHPLGLYALTIGGMPLDGVVIRASARIFPSAYAMFFSRMGRNQVMLSDVSGVAVCAQIARYCRRIQQELFFDFPWYRIAEECEHLCSDAPELFLEVCGVVKYPRMLVPLPCGKRPCIQRTRFFGRFAARGVVGERIMLLCAVCCGHQMKNRVIPMIAQLVVSKAEAFDDRAELFGADIRFIVHNAAIAQNHDILALVAIAARSFHERVLLHKNVAQDRSLKRHDTVGYRINAAIDQFGGRFGDH